MCKPMNALKSVNSVNRIRFLLVNRFSSLAEICFQEFPLSEIFLLFGLMLDLLDLTSGSIIV